MIKLKKLAIPLLTTSLVIALGTLALWPKLPSVVSNNSLIQLAVNKVYAEPSSFEYPTDLQVQSTAYAQLNKTGCTEHHGNLQLRIDFYLTEESPRYADTYVQVPDIPPDTKPPEDEKDFDEWLKQWPLKWQLNPFHSHFIYVNPDITEKEIQDIMAYHLPNFYKAFVEDRWDEVAGGMRHGWDVATRISPTKYDDVLTAEEYSTLKTACETKINELPDVKIDPGKDIISGRSFPSTDIDVGAAATNRTNSIIVATSSNEYTLIERSNPANDTGSIDTVEVWCVFAYAGTNLRVGSFENTSGTNHTCRDNHSCGRPNQGSKTTYTGLDIDIESGDYIGCDGYGSTSFLYIEANFSGGDGVYSAGSPASYCDPAEGSQSYNNRTGDIMSLYGTGETGGGELSIGNDPDSENLGVVADSSTYYAYGSAPSNPVVDGECTFTITNAGSTAFDVDMDITDFTGGTTWNIVSGSPSTNEVRVTAYYSGQNPASGLVLANTPAEFYDGLAGSGTIKWDFKAEFGALTDEPTQHSATITVYAVAED